MSRGDTQLVEVGFNRAVHKVGNACAHMLSRPSRPPTDRGISSYVSGIQIGRGYDTIKLNVFHASPLPAPPPPPPPPPPPLLGLSPRTDYVSFNNRNRRQIHFPATTDSLTLFSLLTNTAEQCHGQYSSQYL
jgi:hypothetical protein